MVIKMKSIKQPIIHTLDINKSTFHNYLIPVDSVEKVTKELDALRTTYPDASHHCFAYIIGETANIQKYSDDGEPSKTAGLPMMDVLLKNDITNVLAVSIRYFGGIKLGASGLIRAYAKGVAENIKKAVFTRLVDIVKVSLSIPFDEIGNVEKHVRDHYHLEDTLYNTGVTYILHLKKDLYDDFTQTINNYTKGKAEIKTIQEYQIYK
jgi:uncharacterized YigZ family protein